jgi:hypothetical protein
MHYLVLSSSHVASRSEQWLRRVHRADATAGNLVHAHVTWAAAALGWAAGV